MITICNLRESKPTNSWDIRVDRASPLGNPFYMTSETYRNQVCDKYEDWFKIKVAYEEPFIINELKSLKEIYKLYDRLNLFCWCAPKRCHAETIKKWLENN
jgi:uncharacterized protein YeaO (DUF488 family)